MSQRGTIIKSGFWYTVSNYLIKENNCDVDIDIDVIDLKIDDDIIYIKYLISETNCIYEYKLEMRDVL